MKTKVYLILMTLLLIINGCNSDRNSTENISILYSGRGIAFDRETEYCIVLPEVGCGGCIAGGVRFIANNRDKFSKNQNKYLVVFTAINSRKLLYRNMGFDVGNELNCLIDSTDLYKVDTNMKFYPMLIKLKEGKITDVAFQHPKAEYDIFQALSKDW